ncbi:MAG: DUF3800 domain-containing protein [Clostridia bacterium]|nr:DUF3800 domain-containing protein [Clostridia bacterium]
MYLVFIDECGYARNWRNRQAIQQQPFYVLAGVAMHFDRIADIYESIRKSIRGLNLPKTEADMLGRGEEIKASLVDKGDGFWRHNPRLRNGIRKGYLNHQDVTYFVVCINKQRHKAQYSSPDDPTDLAVKFLFERLQGFLDEKQTFALVLIDANKREEQKQRTWIEGLLAAGSSGIALSKFYGIFYHWSIQFKRIVEVHFGDSKDSLGLQIADFVARHAYSWRNSDRDASYPGWDLIEPRLYKYPNHGGWGYKEFP